MDTQNPNDLWGADYKGEIDRVVGNLGIRQPISVTANGVSRRWTPIVA